jgi:hypothetical protein
LCFSSVSANLMNAPFGSRDRFLPSNDLIFSRISRNLPN